MKDQIIITDDLFLVKNQFYFSKQADSSLIFYSSDIQFTCGAPHHVLYRNNFIIIYGENGFILFALQVNRNLNINHFRYTVNIPDLYVKVELYDPILKFLELEKLHSNGECPSYKKSILHSQDR